MRFSVRTTSTKFPEMQSAIEGIDGKKISVGVTGEQAWLASIHEYGCRIKVTDKMRKWLHKNGLHIRDTTTEIVIPERSFLRSGFDTYHIRVIERAERVLPLVLDGRMSEDDFFDIVGMLLRDRIRDYAVDLSTPPKHPFTLERNGGKENPLIDSGDMVNSIEFEVT